MITFPLPEGASLVVIEPSNIAVLKAGRGLRVGNHLICFTPDMDAFLEMIGVKGLRAKEGERIVRPIDLAGEDLDAALKKCQSLPEVDR